MHNTSTTTGGVGRGGGWVHKKDRVGSQRRRAGEAQGGGEVKRVGRVEEGGLNTWLFDFWPIDVWFKFVFYLVGWLILVFFSFVFLFIFLGGGGWSCVCGSGSVCVGAVLSVCVGDWSCVGLVAVLLCWAVWGGLPWGFSHGISVLCMRLGALTFWVTLCELQRPSLSHDGPECPIFESKTPPKFHEKISQRGKERLEFPPSTHTP